ncbi:hypothetical protein [Paracoccus zhejiangensis]|uniref:Uncharacterized protein n=1 Tax=Paracoccus zhejiangensis TaxID=1077935 RepID=A0A2H5EY24_9RHOB|nr:hypothetical protein [Paracoccus zhejiangensis]AUH64199.1 hypothetical protein CX676_08560 [Paracoccus zhejiangensis]
MTRITLRIDRIVTDGPGLDRAALERAIRAELTRTAVTGGAGAFGAGRARPLVSATLQKGGGPLTAQVAAAVATAVTP